eukprot:jgi/Chlat1/7560/Chrsp63S07061
MTMTMAMTMSQQRGAWLLLLLRRSAGLRGGVAQLRPLPASQQQAAAARREKKPGVSRLADGTGRVMGGAYESDTPPPWFAKLADEFHTKMDELHCKCETIEANLETTSRNLELISTTLDIINTSWNTRLAWRKINTSLKQLVEEEEQAQEQE